ncbi:hypothetical protein [Nostoc sp. C052]|nr:hypothetical protein [Nostoc sp. C052]
MPTPQYWIIYFLEFPNEQYYLKASSELANSTSEGDRLLARV